jgi:hypothetical protein
MKRNFFVILFLSILAGKASGDTVTSCEPNEKVTIGSYVVGANYWNPGRCPGSQCMTIDDKTGAFTVTKADFNCAPDVASYPFIYYGSHFGSNSPGTILPLMLDQVKCVTSNWSFTPAKSGSWDAAYDIWFSTGISTVHGFGGGAELMIWLDYMGNVPPAGHKVGTVTINGMSWTLWEGPIGWNYIAYLADKPVDSVKDFDLTAFINDCMTRGYIDKEWFLAAVEVGNEFRTGGAPFTSNSFSVAINQGCGSKGPSFPAEATPTPAAKP